MLKHHGFNLWADSYDDTVKNTEKSNQYPFAGYTQLMNAIYGTIITRNPTNILDIGFGTALLTSRFYKAGIKVTGIDFSIEMIKIAQEKMPQANLLHWDFTKGLPTSLSKQSFDFIISTYALHHLDDKEKVRFITLLLDLLKPSGSILIGDIGFQTREELLHCKNNNQDSWDKDEIYFVYNELHQALQTKCKLTYHPFSFCCGVIEIKKLNCK